MGFGFPALWQEKHFKHHRFICELFVCPRAHTNIIGAIVGRQVFAGAATVHRLLRARDPQPLVPPQAGSQGSTQGGVTLFIGQNCVFKLFL